MQKMLAQMQAEMHKAPAGSGAAGPQSNNNTIPAGGAANGHVNGHSKGHNV